MQIAVCRRSVGSGRAFSIAGIDDEIATSGYGITPLAHDATTPREFVSDQVNERRRARARRSLEV